MLPSIFFNHVRGAGQIVDSCRSAPLLVPIQRRRHGHEKLRYVQRCSQLCPISSRDGLGSTRIGPRTAQIDPWPAIDEFWPPLDRHLNRLHSDLGERARLNLGPASTQGRSGLHPGVAVDLWVVRGRFGVLPFGEVDPTGGCGFLPGWRSIVAPWSVLRLVRVRLSAGDLGPTPGRPRMSLTSRAQHGAPQRSMALRS